jgi:hypothetical protein
MVTTSFSRLSGISAFAGTIALALSGWVAAVSGGSPSAGDDQALYVPIQSISYEFGSKSMSGYFLEQGATCFLTLMIAEKNDPEEPLPLSPTRVRLVLYPGQIAGLDSEEGRSLNFTCGDGATTLLVDVGERDRLMKLQTLAVEELALDSSGQGN